MSYRIKSVKLSWHCRQQFTPFIGKHDVVTDVCRAGHVKCAEDCTIMLSLGNSGLDEEARKELLQAKKELIQIKRDLIQ